MKKFFVLVALVVLGIAALNIVPTAFARGGHKKCFDAQAQCYASCATEDTKQARKACIQKHRCFYALREMCPDICEYPKDLCYKTCDEQETPGTDKMKSCKASCNGLPREVCPDGSPPQ